MNAGKLTVTRSRSVLKPQIAMNLTLMVELERYHTLYQSVQIERESDIMFNSN